MHLESLLTLVLLQMEDLDSLLEDLGRGKSSSTVKKQRPPSSRVDLNELEDLMEDLAAPTSKQVFIAKQMHEFIW